MPPRKRKAEEAPQTPETSTSRRRSTRISSSSKRSKYFESESDSEKEPGKKASSGRSSAAKTSRQSSAKRAKVQEEEGDDDSDTYHDDEDGGVDPENDVNDEDDEEFDEEAPPKVTFIPRVQLRDDGGIPYTDDRVHKNTMLFLADLKANNKRAWLKSHDEEYRRSLKDWQSYVETITEKIIEADETVPELPFKDVVFRIYRDIRFSNDPTPYKPHYSAAWSRTGRKGPYACYYIHLEPGKCFVGGGLWHPDGTAVAKLRASIDERPQRWRRVLCDPAFRRTFLPDAKSKKVKGKVCKEDDEKMVLQAFADSNKEGALKTKPKGFNADHRDIELLKLRNYTVGTKLSDNVFTSVAGQAEVAEVISAMVGFVTHLNNIVMPDPDVVDDESSEEDEEEPEHV